MGDAGMAGRFGIDTSESGRDTSQDEHTESHEAHTRRRGDLLLSGPHNVFNRWRVTAPRRDRPSPVSTGDDHRSGLRS